MASRVVGGRNVYLFRSRSRHEITGPSVRRGSEQKATAVGLVGLHFPPARRIRRGLLVGFGASYEQSDISNYQAGTGTLIPEFSGTSTETVPIVTYGLDAEIPVTQQLTLVPRLRGHLRLGYYLGRGTIIRPGVALRWAF